MLRRKDDTKKLVDNMDSSDRDEAIKRLERERIKVNEEIESILSSYAKESGIHSLKPRRRRSRPSQNDWEFDI